MNFTQKQEAAVRKHAIDLLLETKAKTLGDITPHRMTWGELCASEGRAKALAAKLLDDMGNVPEGPVADTMNEAHGAILEAFDAFKREKDIRSEIGNREPRDRPEDPKMLARRPGVDPVTVHPDGTTGESTERAFALAPEERMTTWAQARGGQSYSGLSLGGYLRSMIIGGKTDIERRALSEGSDSAGGYTVPTELSAQLIDKLRAQSVVVRAGAQTVPVTSDNLSFAKLLTDPTPAWRSEAGPVAESDPTFGPVNIVPRSLAVMTKISYELMADSINLEQQLPNILTAALAVELDRAALEGTGSAPQPRGIRETVGIGTAAIGGVPDFDDLIDAQTAILSANAGPVSALIMHPRDSGAMAKLKYGDGHYIGNAPALEGIPRLTTTSIATNRGTGTDESTIYAGNFRHMMIGVRQDIRIELIRELYAANLQYALIAHLRADVAVAHAAAFYTMTGVKTA